MLEKVRNSEIGDKIIFYSNTREGCLTSSSLAELATRVREIQGLHYDRQMLWSLLTYGYSPTCHTIYEEIWRIPAGCELIVDDNNVGSIHRYHMFTNKPCDLSFDECIAEWDRLFRQAVKRILDANEEQHKPNLFSLSAGMDCRMTTRVAHELTSQPVINVTYSQSSYYDDVVAHEIAAFLGNQLIFIPIDGGNYLRNVDAAIQRTHGLINYTGPAQVMNAYDKIAADNTLGVVGTGIGGDILIHFAPKTAYQPMQFGEGAICNNNLEHLFPLINEEYTGLYPNREIDYVYTSGFHSSNLGTPLVLNSYSGSMSPYMDVDFLTFALSVPYKYRVGYRIHDEWIRRYYPDMMQWLHNGTERIGARHKRICIAGRTMRINELPQRMVWKVLKELHLYDGYRLSASNSMNPEDTWLTQNAELKAYLDSYFEENIKLLSFEPELQMALRNLYSMTAVEKLQAITVVGVVKNFQL